MRGLDVLNFPFPPKCPVFPEPVDNHIYVSDPFFLQKIDHITRNKQLRYGKKKQ